MKTLYCLYELGRGIGPLTSSMMSDDIVSQFVTDEN